MKVVQDDLWLCVDCTIAAVNGDYSGLGYGLSEAEAAERMAAVHAGFKRLGPHLVCAGQEVEFMRRGCDCCLDGLAGDKTEFAVLGVE